MENLEDIKEVVVIEVVHCLREDLQELPNSNRFCWVKDWLEHRSNLGTSSMISKELADEFFRPSSLSVLAFLT